MRCAALLLAAICSFSFSGDFYDDFEDEYIEDWSEKGHSADWWAESGQLHVSTSGYWAGLAAPTGTQPLDGAVSTLAMGYHAPSIFARLDETETGVYGLFSPDNDVARIRRVVNGNASTILTSIYVDFQPSHWYEMTFEFEGVDLHLEIEDINTGDVWDLYATDNNAHPGEVGLATGQEPEAVFEWFGLDVDGDVELSAFDVDDDNVGWSSGDGDGAFEAGESIELGLALENTGGETLENAFGILQSLSAEISVPAGNCNYGDIEPGETAWPSPDFGLEAESSAPEDETYPFKLTVFADGGYSGVHEFDLPLGCGLQFDMEGETGGWYTESLGAGWGDQWHQSDQRNHTPGGSESFKCGDTGYGDYGDGLHCAMVSPLFNVPYNSTLWFWMWIDAQCVRADEAYDGGRLQIGQLGSWEDLEPSGGYPYEIASGTTGPFEPGTGVWSGTSGWQMLFWELPNELSGPRRLRWVFGSDESGTREGWYIDDLLVEAPMGTPGESGSPVPGRLRLSASPNPFSSSVDLALTGLFPGETALLEIYDIAGRKVLGRTVSPSREGFAAVQWSGGSAGLYLVRARRGGDVRTIRVVRTE